MCDISIVIVSFNTSAFLIECLYSIFSDLDHLDAEIWVVDNASTDGSPGEIKKHFPQVKLIENNRNVGFARANNQALCQATGRICMLLNPDTVIKSGALISIMSAFETNFQVGLVSPQLLNTDGSIQPSWGQFSSLWTEFFFQFFLFKVFPSTFPLGNKIHWLQGKAYNTVHEIDWATGACLAFRREIIEKIGLLDESIFMYGEDMEWCWRMKKVGIHRIYWPEAKVFHLQNQASKSNYAQWIINYTYGQIKFIEKHRSKISTKIAGLMVMIGSLLRIVAWASIQILKPEMRKIAKQRNDGYRKAFMMGWKALMGREL